MVDDAQAPDSICRRLGCGRQRWDHRVEQWQGDGGGDHSRASGGYLSGVHVKKSDSVVEAGISMVVVPVAVS